ncbi:hypothetical protein B0A50_03875 [Salinomyces thailandicus]|uniref:N-acetyltransferase domain-containing protein n=1 Tax=Salinomyces thailandicus TaxID=706561 RepID=A0A4U0U0S9_9PEZI|nr:hypothetical protein B0A50_03875 [Salinomyces thailandica]
MTFVRPRTPDDLDACVEVLQNVYNKDGYPVQGTANAHAFLTTPSTEAAWVAETETEHAKTIIGHIAVNTADPSDPSAKLWRTQHPDDGDEAIAILKRLFVHPEYRGKGVAVELVRAAELWVEDMGRKLVLFALMKDEGAMRLYRRCGWVEFGRAEFCWGEEERMEAVCFVSPGV